MHPACLHTMLTHFSNGNTPGITFPGVQGQEDVIRKAYASARLDMKDTVYVEVRKLQIKLKDHAD
jgi:acyl transferase domain-containing protein